MMKATAAGALRSKTVWFAVALAMLSTLAGMVDRLGELLKEYRTPIGVGLAVIIAGLRVYTETSLASKAAPPEPPHDDGKADGSS